jgi:hypothetical protein
MEILRAKTKQELLKEVPNLDGGSEVYMNLRPTVDVVDAIRKQCPNVKRITCPPSLYRQTAKKVFKLVEGAGIALAPGDFKVGRPNKWDKEQVKGVLTKRSSGLSAKAIAQELDMPLRTVYFYLKNGLNE